MGQRTAVLHCDANIETGMGHLMRTLTIAEAARRRGWSVRVVGEIDAAGMSAASRAEPAVEVESITGAALLATLTEAVTSADVVHIDSYRDLPDLGDAPALISNMQDGPYGVRAAGLSIDANLGAEVGFARPDLSWNALAGIDLAVVREQVLRQRDAHREPGSPRRLLVVMGGSDARGLTARVVRSLDGLDQPLVVTVVDPRGRGDVRTAAEKSTHDVEVVGFLDDLPAAAREHDLVVTAAGTSVWDFAYMGLPMALVCAVDNQRSGYEHVISAGLAVGLGAPPHDDLGSRMRALDALLADPDGMAAHATRLRRTVDGLGAWRIVASWEQLLDAASEPASVARPPAARLHARSATAADARLLFEWRNDPETRARSRSSDVVPWESHVAWLSRAIDDPDRRLLVVLSGDIPVATARWDRLSGTDWEVSLTVAPEHRGRGLAAAVLATAESALAVDAPVRHLAAVHSGNEPSLKLFRRAGYLPHRPADADGLLALARWRLDEPSRSDPR